MHVDQYLSDTTARCWRYWHRHDEGTSAYEDVVASFPEGLAGETVLTTSPHEDGWCRGDVIWFDGS